MEGPTPIAAIPSRKTRAQVRHFYSTEGFLLAAFREYEFFLQSLFFRYALEKAKAPGVKLRIHPSDAEHLNSLLKIQNPGGTVDWNKTDVVIRRAEIFFKNGMPFSTALRAEEINLREIVAIRNRAAHNSGEAQTKYLHLLRQYFGIPPSKVVVVGEYLSLPSKSVPTITNFEHYMNVLEITSERLSL